MECSAEVWSALVLNRMEGLGPIRVHTLIQHFKTAQAVLAAGTDGWSALLNETELCAKLNRELDRYKKESDSELKRCQSAGIKFWILTSDAYPALLKEIRLPPLLLYVKGDLDPKTINSIALVGSRRCSYYGERMARSLVRGLVEAEFSTVSGLARGIDAFVHAETLAQDGMTVGVVGCGLDQCYPSEHKDLMNKIAKTGAVISEFPLGSSPLPGNFPRRNRIIAGLSRGTVVVEGTLRSGSLITACLAAQEGREVFAVPGLATSPLSEAPNMLIQQGATLTRDVRDILEGLGLGERNPGGATVSDRPVRSFTPAEIKILSLLEAENLHREDVFAALSIPTENASHLLVQLELAGHIKSFPGGYFGRV